VWLFVCWRAKVVICLSEHVRNDTLLDKPHRINKPCRRQLKFELLQRVCWHYFCFWFFRVTDLTSTLTLIQPAFKWMHWATLHYHSDLFWAATSASSQMIPILSKLTVLLQFACGRSGSLLNPGISRCNACRELLTEMKNWKQLITDSNEDRWDHLERQSQKWRQLKEDRFIFVEIRTNCWDGWDASWEWTTPE